MSDELNNPDDKTKLFMSLTLSSQKEIYLYILSLVMSPPDADDILQDTLSIMWNKFDEFEPGTSFVAWGRKIARYKIMDYFRKNKSSKLCYDQDVIDIIESKAGKIDDLTDRKHALKECLQKLSVKYQDVLYMRYVQDMSFKQMAVRFGIAKQSAYRTLTRVHAILLKCVKHSLEGGTSYGR